MFAYEYTVETKYTVLENSGNDGVDATLVTEHRNQLKQLLHKV
jgi:hypothetical protein